MADIRAEERVEEVPAVITEVGASSGVVPPASNVPGEIVIKLGDIGPLTRLKPFDIRNGEACDAHSLLIRPTIPDIYHWQPIEGMPYSQAIENTPAYINQALAYLSTKTGHNLSAENLRKVGIILGVTRSVMTGLFRIVTDDIVPGEWAEPYLKYVLPRGPDERPRVVVRNGVAPAIAAKLKEELDLTEDEKNAVAALHMSAIGLIPVQGYSLIMTGHHYLSDGDNPSKKAYATIEKQFWKDSKVMQWWNANLQLVQDVLWHKAAHPVQMEFKRAMAQSDRIRKVLITVGAGSAASRLPAMEPELRKANSYHTLLSTVRPMFEMYKGKLEFGVLEDAIAGVKQHVAGIPVANLKMDLPPDYPQNISSRTEALDYLNDVCMRNADSVAFAYGFYVQLSEQSSLSGGAGAPDTLKNSYSLKGLRTQSYASYVQGTQAYGDFAASRNKDRMAGKFISPRFVLH